MLFACLTAAFGISSFAQTVTISAEMDSASMMIGQQTLLHLTVAADKGQRLILPFITDTLTTGVEVLGISRVDTADIGNGRVAMKYDYLITSFDEELYTIPPFRVISENDTVYSRELALKVTTLPVDTVSKKFYDIKDVATPPFVLWDYISPWILVFVLLGVALLGIIVYILIRRSQHKSIIPFAKPEPELPLHQRILKELDEVKAQKLWQQGKVKAYHSDITDILRRYIVERFGIEAMEMTSAEILDKIKGYSEADAGFDNLKQILVLADYVKFAKFNPLPDENELSMMNAYLFVNNTKKEELPAVIAEEEEKTENSK
jgi:hypothetical protein